MSTVYGPFNLYQIANIPGWENIYTGDVDHTPHPKGGIYWACRIVDKNHNSNKWDTLIIHAPGDNTAHLVHRFVQGTTEYPSKGGAVAITVDPVTGNLQITITNDFKGTAMFPPLTYILVP
jgi:hypothetical protein